MQTSYDYFWFNLWLVKKVGQISQGQSLNVEKKTKKRAKQARKTALYERPTVCNIWRDELHKQVSTVWNSISDFHRFTGKGRYSPQLGWDASSLTSFQRLIIVKVLRPECLVESVRLFVVERMGSKFVTSVGFDLQEIFEESNNRKPLIFILSPGNCLLLFSFLNKFNNCKLIKLTKFNKCKLH